jgi:hypothetical protein
MMIVWISLTIFVVLILSVLACFLIPVCFCAKQMKNRRNQPGCVYQPRKELYDLSEMNQNHITYTWNENTATA